MAWNSRTNWTTGQTVAAADLNSWGLDIRTWGGNVDAGGNQLLNLGNLATGGATITGSAKSSASVAGFLISSNDVSNQLQAFMSLDGSSNPRLAISCVEQGVAFHNITLCEGGGSVGIGTTTPLALLSLAPTLGDKLAVYDAGTGNLFGFGIQAALFQIYTPNSSCATSIGYGASTSFTPVLSVVGPKVGIGTTAPTSPLQVVGVPTFASDSAAGTGGLTAGAFYKDSSGGLHVKL